MSSEILKVNQQTAYSAAINYTRHLVQIPSITPNDNGCMAWLASKLEQLDFECTWLNTQGVTNLVACFDTGRAGKSFAFSGHTDVVPVGDESGWWAPPFSAEIINSEIIGRGVADMKAGVAAFISALETVFNETALAGKIYILLTSDEEGEAEYGTKVIKQYLDDNSIALDYCLVGEPTSNQAIGDAIKVGRRGALSAKLRCAGKQGHVAYPQFATNAIHQLGKIIAALNSIEWDQGSEDFPGTSLQITHISSGSFTDNIIPGNTELCFNIRYSYQHTEQSLKALIKETLASLKVNCQISWERPCEPYLTSPNQKHGGDFIGLVEQVIFDSTDQFPVLSTSGGTSDGRFLASEQTQVIELGLKNHTIHQVNERATIADIDELCQLYQGILNKALSANQ